MKMQSKIYELILPLCLMLVGTLVQAQAPENETTHDGLVRKADSKVTAVYIKPDTDFSQYNRLMIEEPHVAFTSKWRRKNRRLDHQDIEAIKSRAIELFTNEFTKVLKDGKYGIATTSADDVLLIRPAIIDLEISSPIDASGVQSITYTTKVGSASLVLELFDSVSSEILARAIDKRVLESASGNWQVEGSSVNNNAEAVKAIRHWATLLKEALGEIRK